MWSLTASARRGALALVLVLGVFGLTPGLSGAQPAPQPLVARCDMPVLDLFNPLPGDVLPTSGDYLISGLALDPMAQEGTSGIDEVTFYLGHRDNGGVPLGIVVPTNGQRMADFSLNVTLPDNDSGKQSLLEAIAHSALSGKETQVTLPIMLGRNTSPTSPAPTAADTINTNPGTLPQSCAPSDIATLQLNPPGSVVSTPASQAPLAPHPVAATPNSLFATVVGQVSTCHSGVEQPLTQATVQVQGTSATAQSNEDGEFAIAGVPAPGTYTILVSENGNTATRMYVPVAPGETIDIGVLQIGADVGLGCGNEVASP